jgi:hypothetical protein
MPKGDAEDLPILGSLVQRRVDAAGMPVSRKSACIGYDSAAGTRCPVIIKQDREDYMSEIDLEKAREMLRRHRAHPDVSAREYFRQLTNALGESLSQRKKLYLDTRYWVFLRDAALGRAKRPEHNGILELLRKLVHDGVVVCPVSDVAFMELTTQSDDVTRAATGKLWDELSQGVALFAERDRVRYEFENFLRHPEAEQSGDMLARQVWTKAGYVLGLVVPTNEAVPEDRLRVIQKASIDAGWETSFLELANESAAHLSSAQSFEDTAQKINAEMRQFQNEIPSFERAFLSECIGALSLHQTDISHILVELYEEGGNSLEEVTRSQFIEFREKIVGMLVDGFRYKRDRMATRLPLLYVHSACHAAIRMDVQRKFNGNFLRDLHHGVAGGTYHDAMFTERPLQVLLTSGNVAVDKIFGSKIFSREEDVLSYLRTLSM